MNEESIQKYIKQVRDESNEDMKKHIGVLIENINDKFKVTQEEMASINEKLDTHTEMLGELMEDKTLLKVQVSDHEHRISALETSIA